MSLLATLLLSTVTVTLPAEAKVRGTEMTIGDIAVVTGSDDVDVKAVEDYSLGYAPAPGYGRTLRDWKVKQDIKRALPEIDLLFAGAPATRIWPEVATIETHELEQEALKAVRAIFGKDEVRLSTASDTRQVSVPLGETSRSLQVDVEGQPKKPGQWNVPVRILVDGAQYTTTWVRIKVEVFKQLPVLLRDLRAGEEVTAADVRLERVLVDGSFGGRALKGMPTIGALTARPLQAGAILSEGDLHRAFAVTRGQVAVLQIINGSVSAKVHVVVQDNAYIGSDVRVNVTNSGKELTCRVTGRDELRISLGNSRAQTRN